MRLDKYLADCGAGTRSEIKKIIKSGGVQVLGVEKPKADLQIDPETAGVMLWGKKLVYRKFIYLMMNKPQGYISATWDKKLPTVLNLVPEEYQHFEPFPVGRLDIDTEGLCLITNDGQLAHRLLSPVSHIPKIYTAQINMPVTKEDIEAFKKGITLDDGYLCKPALLETTDDETSVYVTITEGKFHQVKRMFEACGKKVLYLKRIAMNQLVLDENLELGEVRELTDEEILLLDWKKEEDDLWKQE